MKNKFEFDGLEVLVRKFNKPLKGINCKIHGWIIAYNPKVNSLDFSICYANSLVKRIMLTSISDVVGKGDFKKKIKHSVLYTGAPLDGILNDSEEYIEKLGESPLFETVRKTIEEINKSEKVDLNSSLENVFLGEYSADDERLSLFDVIGKVDTISMDMNEMRRVLGKAGVSIKTSKYTTIDSDIGKLQIATPTAYNDKLSKEIFGTFAVVNGAFDLFFDKNKLDFFPLFTNDLPCIDMGEDREYGINKNTRVISEKTYSNLYREVLELVKTKEDMELINNQIFNGLLTYNPI